jgi:hypothetical protein
MTVPLVNVMLVTSRPSIQAEVLMLIPSTVEEPFSVMAEVVIEAMTEFSRAMIFTKRPVCAAVFVMIVAFVGAYP